MVTHDDENLSPFNSPRLHQFEDCAEASCVLRTPRLV